MMSIIYDHQIFGTQKYGGSSRYFFEIASRISRLNDHCVKIIAPLYVNEYLRFSDLQITGTHFPLFRGAHRFVKPTNTILSSLFSRLVSEADIFHETNYLIADLKPRKAIRVVTVHDMIHEKFEESFSPNDSTVTVKAHVIRRADHVICVSENTRKDLIEILGVEQEKTSVVYHGCSLRAENKLEQSFGNCRPYILYVGARGGYKNFETLVRAYAKRDRLRKEFDLYCFGGGEFNKPELTLISSLAIQNSVRYFSGDDNILAGLYSSAEAFVYPSLYEGFGIPPLEAMSYGCPVVCSNTSSLPEVLGDAAEMFDPSNEEAVSVAIERVVFSNTYREELVIKGHSRSAIFSWDRCARDTLDVYRKLKTDVT